MRYRPAGPPIVQSTDWCRPARQPDGQNDHVAERVQVREIDGDEGRRVLRIIRRGTGSVVITWRNRHADDRRLRAVVDRANLA